jgi:thioredoxin-like negative regulator of GroEL
LVPLEKIPYPPFVKVLAALTLIAFIVGLVRAPRAIALGIDNERGKRALEAGRYPEAAIALHRVFRAYPDANEARLDYATACLKADHLEEVFETLQWFEGKPVTKEEEERLNSIADEFSGKMKALEAEGKAAEKAPGAKGE